MTPTPQSNILLKSLELRRDLFFLMKALTETTVSQASLHQNVKTLGLVYLGNGNNSPLQLLPLQVVSAELPSTSEPK